MCRFESRNWLLSRNLDSSVIIVTNLQVRLSEVRTPKREKGFIFSSKRRASSRVYPATYSMGTGCYLLGKSDRGVRLTNLFSAEDLHFHSPTVPYGMYRDKSAITWLMNP